MTERNNEKMISRGIQMLPSMWEECDRRAQEHNCGNRNDFIRDAITFYMEWLDRSSSEKFLTPALESVVGAKIRDTEERLARLLFKMAVEENMLAHILETVTELDETDIENMRVTAIREVKESNGTVSLEKIFRGR